MTIALQVPASPAQRRLWAVDQAMPGSAQHHLHLEIARDDVLDPAALRAGLDDVIARHEALRTGFAVAEGVLHQVVAAQVTGELRYADLSALPPGPARDRYQELSDEQAAAPFDLAAPPLLRLGQVRRTRADGGACDTLLLTIHHLVADAASVEIILDDLMIAAQARAAGLAPGWEPPAVQYADYCQWLAARAATAQAAADRAYWREHLAGLADLDLTAGRPRPAELTDRGEAIAADLGPARVRALRALAVQQHASLFMVLAGAYAAALGRVFGAADVPVGMSVAGRPLLEVAGTVGLFAERLVLRLDTGGRPSFRQLADRARAEVLAALDHDHVGFDEIVEVTAPPRRYGVTPLAQASINLHHAPVPAGLRRPADHGAPRRAAADAVRHDIALVLIDTGKTVEGTLEYRPDVVSPAAARRVAELFEAILDAGLRDPDAPVTAVPAVGAAELRRLHAEQDGGPARPAGFLLDRVAGWAAATPDALAVDAPDGRLSYRGLWDQAAVVAAGLRGRGVAAGAETPVLVAVPRGAALPAGLLGVLAAGAVYVPVDPAAPAAYLASVAELTGARLVLVAAGGPAPSLPPGLSPVPVDAAGPAPAADLDQRPGVSPASAAYIIFTSGSTGTPKGVIVEHRSLSAYLGGVLGLLAAPPGAGHLLVQPATFDSSLTTLGGALASGGVLRIADEPAARDPAALGRLLAAAPADYLKITPSHLTALLAGVGAEVLRPRRALVLGGEPARRDLTDGLIAAGWAIIGHYGPTETTVGVLARELPGPDGTGPDGTGPEGDAWPSTVAVGGPLPGVRCYVVDEDGSPVPPGCQGELLVSGPLVARGYAAAPGLTAWAFRPDPFSGVPGARLYHTGDIVRRLPDGTFEFCGRRDRQLKIRGHRVEPAATERVLTGRPDVAGAVVVPRDDRLVAYVVLRGDVLRGGGAHAADLRREAGLRLPAHLVPDVIVPVDRLPLTTAGKLDLAALPDPGAGAGPAAGGPEQPGTPTEARLAELWRQVLGPEHVSVTDRFFDAGGDSIRAIYLVGEAVARGLPLTARDVFDDQTIRGLAARIDAAAAREPRPAGAAASGLGAATRPVIIDLPGAWAGPAGAAPEEWRPDGRTDSAGLTVTGRGDRTEVTADPVRWDDRALAELAVRAGWCLAKAPGRTAERNDVAGGAVSDEAAVPDGAAGGAAIRVPLAGPAIAALAAERDDPGHVAYGSAPLDLAVAAVLAALAAGSAVGPAAEAPGPAPAEPLSVRLLVTDIGPPADGAGSARNAVPAAVAMAVPPGGWADAGQLIQQAKGAVREARSAAPGWATRALSGRETIPEVALRLLPLPAGARLADAGIAPPDPDGTGTRAPGAVLRDAATQDSGTRDSATPGAATPGAAAPAERGPGAVRTVIVATGAELVVVPSTAAGRAAAEALAARVADQLLRLAVHCRATGPVYAPGDFPDAGLDEAGLTRLLDRIGVAPGGSQAGDGPSADGPPPDDGTAADGPHADDQSRAGAPHPDGPHPDGGSLADGSPAGGPA
jgi:amino acid adenylation domain-containing protein